MAWCSVKAQGQFYLYLLCSVKNLQINNSTTRRSKFCTTAPKKKKKLKPETGERRGKNREHKVIFVPGPLSSG